MSERPIELGDENIPQQLLNEFIAEKLGGADVAVTGSEWLWKVTQAVKNDQKDEALRLLKVMPETLKDIKSVGDTHVIVPHPDHATEDMIDASRRLLLYTDVAETNESDRLKKVLLGAPNTAHIVPQWFKEHRGALTKGLRAHLAYHLTVMSYIHPPAFHTTSRAQKSRRPSPGEQRLQLTLVREGHDQPTLTLGLAYETSIFSKPIELMDVQVNRHELPEDWRGYFKKQAVDISARVKKDERGVYHLVRSEVRLALRNDCQDQIHYRISDGSDEFIDSDHNV